MTNNTFKSYVLIMITTIILSLISVLPIGIFGLIVTAFLASTIGYTITKHHYSFVGLVCACVFLIYLIFSKNLITSIVLLIPLMLSGITLGITYNLKLSEFVTTGVICTIYTIYFLLNVKFLQASGVELFKNSFALSAQDYSDVLMSLYPDQFTQAEIETLIADAMSVLMKFMPSFIIILCGCLALLMLYAFKKVLKITNCDTSSHKPFSEWHADKSFSITFFVIIAISFFLPEQSYISDAVANVLLVSLFVFYIFGLSLADFLLKRKITNSFARRAILVLLVLFTFGTLLFIICFSGAIDGIINIREKITKNNLTKEV